MQTQRALALMPLLAGGLAAAPAHALPAVQLTSASQLLAGDATAYYPTVPAPAPVGGASGPITVSSPYSVNIYANTLTFADGGGFQIDGNDIGFVNENPLTGAAIFPQGVGVLDNVTTDPNTSLPVFNGPDTISFSAPVSEFGLQAFSEDDFQNFLFTVFDGANSLGTFSVLNDPLAATNPQSALPDFTPAFLGARAGAGYAITSVTISDPNLNAQNGFVLGPLSSPAVPEPAPVALLALGAALLPLAVRRRARA